MGRLHRHVDGAAHHHDDLSAYQTGPERVVVMERIFAENDRAADANRAAFDAAGVRCVNLMSSPGAGKTTLLERTLRHLAEIGLRAGVVEGDIETSIDADRLAGLGAQVSLINTGDGFGGECHLDAPMVARGLTRLDLAELDLVLIENVGNLVCPAEFDVGAHDRVMVFSITEGEDKPLKYPLMFRAVEVVLLNKMDLLPHLDFDLDRFLEHLAQVNPAAQVIEVSARTGSGLDAWHAWLTRDLTRDAVASLPASLSRPFLSRPFLSRPRLTGEQGVELLVARDHAGLHAAGHEGVASLDGVDHRQRAEPAPPTLERLEVEELQRHPVGEPLVGEGLHDPIARPDLVEAAVEGVLLITAPRDVAPRAAGARVPVVDLVHQVVRPHPLGDQLGVDVRAEHLLRAWRRTRARSRPWAGPGWR